MRYLKLVMATAALLSAATLSAQDFPVHPLRLTAPYPAGGTVDLLARQVAAVLRPALGQEVVVENVPGAAGALGLQKMLSAAADGHELAIGTDSDMVLVPLVNPEVKFKPTQFRLLGVLTQLPMVLVAGSGVAASNLGQLLADARKPGARPLSVGSYGVGSNAHLCAEDFAARTGIGMLHVPYKGIAPLLQDLQGGHVELAFLPLGGAVYEAVVSGRLRPLALATAQPDKRLPQLPTMAQAAGLKEFVHVSWGSLVVSASVPDKTVERLHQALQDALRNPAFQKGVEASGVLPGVPMTLAQARQFQDREIEKFGLLAAQWQARTTAAAATR